MYENSSTNCVLLLIIAIRQIYTCKAICICLLVKINKSELNLLQGDNELKGRMLTKAVKFVVKQNMF